MSDENEDFMSGDEGSELEKEGIVDLGDEELDVEAPDDFGFSLGNEREYEE